MTQSAGWLVLLALSSAVVTGRLGVAGTENECTQQNTCGTCITANEHCGWCMQTTYLVSNSWRCDIVQNLIANGCDLEYLVTPDHEIDYSLDDAPRDSDEEKNIDAVQLSPQEVHIKLRPNKPITFEVSFKSTNHQPVDMYFLMDMSHSTNDTYENQARLGRDIANAMTTITQDFRLGFGSFVDKTTMPYVSIVPAKSQSPCTGCTAPYGFINQLSLSKDPDVFARRVQEVPRSGNLDAPDGTLDAMMQAVACKTEIGWRDNSRKILLVSTNDDFHYAGDGKLGGIVAPNDGNCHLVNNEYSESLNQDYPSIAQIANKVAEERVNVIFAVPSQELRRYSRLSSVIMGSTVGERAADSFNIVELIYRNYQRIHNRVLLREQSPDGVQVRIKSRCHHGAEWLDKSECDGVTAGQNVTFSVTITVNECPKDPAEYDKFLKIYPVGLAEQLKVKLSLICECPCEKAAFAGIGDIGPPVINSALCNMNGVSECGTCTCNPGHYGKNCVCGGVSTGVSTDYDAPCKRTNDSKICEGRGRCECGECICNPLHVSDPTKTFSGKFCECNNYGCEFLNGQLCGGPTRGVCKCGMCQCLIDYEGTSCDCPKSKASCIAKNNLICNGKGECKCGRCECTLDQYYKGPTCEDCPSCPGQCDANKACVQCTLFRTGPYDEEYCRANCTHITRVREVEKDTMPDRRLCKFRDDDDCDFYFTYSYSSNQVRAQVIKECPGFSKGLVIPENLLNPKLVKILGIVMGVVLGINVLVLGPLCVWKVIVTVLDWRDMDKKRQNTKTDDEPDFKPSTSNFQNPTYEIN